MMENIIENWRPIQQTNGKYEVSDLANIRRADNHRPIKVQRHRQGYGLVQLWMGGKRWQDSLHSIVAHAWIGPRPSGMVVCHKDDDRSDNRPCALRYATQAENVREARRLAKSGEGHPLAKLTADQVRVIRARCDAGERTILIATDYGVSQGAVGHIKARRNWKDI